MDINGLPRRFFEPLSHGAVTDLMAKLKAPLYLYSAKSAYNSGKTHFGYVGCPNLPITGSNISCGVKLIAGVSYRSPAEVIGRIFRFTWGNHPFLPLPASKYGVMLYSDNIHLMGIASGKNSSAQNVTDYIRMFNLGTVSVSDPAKNHNSGNNIQVHTYIPDFSALRDFCLEHHIWKLGITSNEREFYEGDYGRTPTKPAEVFVPSWEKPSTVG